MMGIIAAIIAAVKGHTTYAVCMGIWTVIAFIFLLTDNSELAVAPGGLFVVIAICMKNLRKSNAANNEKREVSDHLKIIVRETDHGGAEFICKKCGKKYSPGWEFCSNCGAPIIEPSGLPKGSNTGAFDDKEMNETLPEKEVVPLLPNSGGKEDNKTPSVSKLSLNDLPQELHYAFHLIEKKEWEDAANRFDKILYENPDNAYAYLGKAMIKAKVRSPENISHEEIVRMCETRSFIRATKLAEGELQQILDNWKEAAKKIQK